MISKGAISRTFTAFVPAITFIIGRPQGLPLRNNKKKLITDNFFVPLQKKKVAGKG
jgi:hypothetical protein